MNLGADSVAFLGSAGERRENDRAGIQLDASAFGHGRGGLVDSSRISGGASAPERRRVGTWGSLSWGVCWIWASSAHPRVRAFCGLQRVRVRGAERRGRSVGRGADATRRDET